MPSQTIETLSVSGGLTNPGGNSLAATIAKPVPSTSPPVGISTIGPGGIAKKGDGVIQWSADGMQSASAIKLMFFGVGSDTNTGLASVYAWDKIEPGSDNLENWIPTLLASFSFELDSGMPGPGTAAIPSSNFFATTITLVTGNSGISVEVVSPGHGNDIAHVVISSKGGRKLEVRYGLNASSTSLNGFYKRM